MNPDSFICPCCDHPRCEAPAPVWCWVTHDDKGNCSAVPVPNQDEATVREKAPMRCPACKYEGQAVQFAKDFSF